MDEWTLEHQENGLEVGRGGPERMRQVVVAAKVGNKREKVANAPGQGSNPKQLYILTMDKANKVEGRSWAEYRKSRKHWSDSWDSLPPGHADRPQLGIPMGRLMWVACLLNGFDMVGSMEFERGVSCSMMMVVSLIVSLCCCFLTIYVSVAPLISNALREVWGVVGDS